MPHHVEISYRRINSPGGVIHRAAVIIDGKMHEIEKLDCRITLRAAYGAGVCCNEVPDGRPVGRGKPAFYLEGYCENYTIEKGSCLLT